MRTSITLSAALAALLQTAAAVTGAAEGFAKGVTGGGSATTVYPTTNAELVKAARVVIKGQGGMPHHGAVPKNIIVQNIPHHLVLNSSVRRGADDAIPSTAPDSSGSTTSRRRSIGRQHIVLGNAANGRVTISNNEIDGQTSWSATCDNHHYWGLSLTGANDLVTLKGNYIHHTSGRAPKVGANTLLHAVNNYFYDNTGHAFEGDNTAMIVAEGNVFQNVKAALDSSFAGKFFASPDTNTNKACAAALGHNCQLNAYGSSGSLKGTNTAILAKFSGKNVASAGLATTANNAVTNAGFGKI
ncbi:pectin lyase [Verticillium alfalfae VaMs.102]|uniref:pectin lyase n=1 Tax=Verticillium alfalfae (strain VaMs.102 / ATCC MYA-4576 / FGSC 10136) TaxID=526221 RepID=C9SW13_VERA1|nr:pectin lyase [Verticillium alfalfae VaMs.102]EEY22978.1 pectin lyase [Verticillium alfalfae VaMs.102]